jgi:hypothetical protein
LIIIFTINQPDRQNLLEKSNFEKVESIKREAENHVAEIQSSVQQYIREQNDKMICTGQKINVALPKKRDVIAF